MTNKVVLQECQQVIAHSTSMYSPIIMQITLIPQLICREKYYLYEDKFQAQCTLINNNVFHIREKEQSMSKRSFVHQAQRLTNVSHVRTDRTVRASEA